MSVLKRNYEIGTFEIITDEPSGVAVFNQWQNFVLEGYFKFEFADIVLKGDGVVIPETDYDLAIDEVYTAKEATVDGTKKTLYAEFRINNAAHAGKSITVSGLNFGTMVDNEEVKRYVDDRISAVVRTVVEISEDTDAVNNTTYLVTTVLGGDPVTVTMPSVLVPGFNIGVYKITDIETPEVCVDGNGILIGSQIVQEIVGESEGISIITDGKYFINQDNRGAVQRKLSQSTGVFSGFDVTPNVDPTKIDIGPGIFEVEDASDMLSPVSATVQFDGVVGYPIDSLSIQGITFVYIDVDKNLTQETNITTSPEQWRTKARIATVQHFFGTGTVENALPYHTPPQNPSSRVSTLLNTLGIIREGVIVSGASAGNLQLANTSGVLVSPGSNQYQNSLNPDNVSVVAADPILAIVYLTQNLVVRLDTGAGAVVDVANYDVSGTITAVGGPAATSVIHRVYIGIDGTIAVQYGQNTYQTLQQAKDALFSGEDIFVQNPILNKITTLLCYVIATKTATDLNDTNDALFFVTDKFGGGGTISGGGAGASTMQEAYDNSIADPEILTSAIRKALDIRNGSGNDADSVLTVQNIAGTKILDVTGEKAKVTELESSDGSDTSLFTKLGLAITELAGIVSATITKSAISLVNSISTMTIFAGSISLTRSDNGRKVSMAPGQVEVYGDNEDESWKVTTLGAGRMGVTWTADGVASAFFFGETDGTFKIDHLKSLMTSLENFNAGVADPTTIPTYGGLNEGGGVWTPVLEFGGSNVGMTGTFEGSYFKIGRLVTCNFAVLLTAKGTSTGIANIEGLPFTPSDLLPSTGVEANGVISLASSFVGLNGLPHLTINSNGQVRLTDIDGAGEYFDIDNSSFGNTTAFRGSFSYITD